MKLCASAVVLLALFCYQGSAQFQSQRSQVHQTTFNGQCLDRNGRYPVADQCDKYIECRDGVPEEKYCDDGLLFNANASLFTFPCQYPIDVKCESRARLQLAQSTEECPHQFGYFKLGDEAHCGEFLNCAAGRGYKLTCPVGLAFNPATYQCDWPDVVAECNAEAFVGFTCPPETQVEGFGPGETRFYRSPEDCQRYFLCNNGRPRLHLCGVGSAFDADLNRCEAAQNVTGCEHLAVTEEPEKKPIYLKTLKFT